MRLPSKGISFKIVVIATPVAAFAPPAGSGRLQLVSNRLTSPIPHFTGLPADRFLPLRQGRVKQ